MNKKYINFNSISKKYDDLRIFDNLSLEIEKSKYICIVGPSGCGKTTLLRLLAGLENIQSGNIEINDVNLNKISVIDRNISFAFQNYALYPHLTVFDNLAFPLKSKTRKQKYPNKESIVKEVNTISNLLEINDLLDRKVNMISGGQQQRTSLGRALITKPDILLLDEPLTHLDAKLRYSTRIELKKIQKLLNITVLHVTHDQQEALAVADHIVIFEQGKIIQQDSPLNLLYNPQHYLVDKIIGDPPSSILECKISDNKIQIFDTIIKFENTKRDSIKNVSEEFYVSLKSKNIVISETKKENSSVGEVYSYEVIGKEKQLIIKVGKFTLKHRTNINYNYKINQKIFITFETKNLRFYYKKNGKFAFTI